MYATLFESFLQLKVILSVSIRFSMQNYQYTFPNDPFLSFRSNKDFLFSYIFYLIKNFKKFEFLNFQNDKIWTKINFFSFILYNFLRMCVNFHSNLLFSRRKVNKIKSYYDLRKTHF